MVMKCSLIFINTAFFIGLGTSPKTHGALRSSWGAVAGRVLEIHPL